MSGKINRQLTPSQLRALDNVDWGQKNFGALVASGPVRLRTLRALEKKGLVRSLGLVSLCDDDGFLLVPERYRGGWGLTAKGQQVLAATRKP